MRNILIFSCLTALAWLTGPDAFAQPPATPDGTGAQALVNRVSWGAMGPLPAGLTARQWLDQQLHPGADDGLPPAVKAQIDALDISHTPLTDIAAQVRELQRQAAAARKGGGDNAKGARKPYAQALIKWALEAETRSLLRDLYSRNQLKERLDWFWLNHFSVYDRKRTVAQLVGNYEETAIRPHALGKFRDLLAATAFHPAMLEYLDNQQNAADKINENYAREIMELHTMGVGSGYTQKDVQELARILTGVGINLTGRPRAQAKFARPDYQTNVGDGGLFEFVPARHDFGDKIFLGQTIKGSGLAEVGQAIDILSRQPATARHVSTQLAQYFCCDAPSKAVVDAMATTWAKTDGDIAAVLRTLFDSPEFTASLGHKFKDPMEWTLSALRVSFGASSGDRVIVNMVPVVQMLQQLGEPLYGHETPDGYPMTEAAWSGPGQMQARFDVARQIGAGAPRLFVPMAQADIVGARKLFNDKPAKDMTVVKADDGMTAAPPVLQETAYYRSLTLPGATKNAMAQAGSQADRNMLFLASPDFMRH